MNEYLLILRYALREELDATNTYDKLLAIADDKDKAVIEEIKKDEVNHQGRLLQLILKHELSALEPFNAGLDQEE